MIKKLDHIGIVVHDIEDARQAYETLGLTVTHVQEVPNQQVKVAFLPVGDTEVELVQPTTTDSGVVRFLEKRGEGVHHICFEVEDIEATLADLRAKGMRLIDRRPRQGAFGRVAFLHPKSTHGVLIELVEK
ncbi:MAG TPA: methylmalonyl-CoA epimerase [Anaerolineae bacterium]|nr:methylmalonyl-CoA epimerase [Anaerolineae bacterium]